MAERVRHVEDDRQVGGEDEQLHPRNLAKQFVDFDWDVEAAGDEGEPFGPAALMPESIGFHAANDGVEQGGACDHPEIRIGHATRGIDEDMGIMARGVEVAVTNESFGDGLDIVVHEREQAKAGGEYQGSFRRFEKSDEPDGGEGSRMGVDVEDGFLPGDLTKPRVTFSCRPGDCRAE